VLGEITSYMYKMKINEFIKPSYVLTYSANTKMHQTCKTKERKKLLNKNKFDFFQDNYTKTMKEKLQT
jgi:hypothetical protein